MSYEAEEADAANNHGQDDPRDCPADVGSCWCCLDAGHDGPHECGGLDCNGAWTDDDDRFKVVRMP